MKPTTISSSSSSSSSSPAAAIAAATSIATANFSSRVCRLSRPYRPFPRPFTAIPIPAASTQHGRIKNRHALLVCQLIAEPHTAAAPQPQPQPQPAPLASPQIAASSASSYTSMRDDPLSFWANEHTPLRNRQPSPSAATQEKKKKEEEAAFLVAELRLLANAAADRAEMHGILATQRDNWNKLFQHTLTAASMTATVLAAVSGAMASNAASLTLPAALLNAGAAAMMSVINQFQPSQLAEEQRTAARLFRKLVSDIHYAIENAPHLRQPSAVLLRDCRRRLHALDKAFPMPLTPGGLEKFPSQMLPPVLIAPLAVDRPSAAHNQKRSEEEEEEEAGISCGGGGWNAELEAELRGVAARLRRSDINTYTSWARNLVKINKSLAIAAPMLAAAAALLNVAQPVLVAAGQMVAIQHLGVMAAACSAMAAFAGSFSNDMQMGMVAELYRNSAGYYANIEGSINEALGAPAEEREHGELFRQRVAYELGRSPTASALIPADTKAPAGTLF